MDQCDPYDEIAAFYELLCWTEIRKGTTKSSRQVRKFLIPTLNVIFESKCVMGHEF